MGTTKFGDTNVGGMAPEFLPWPPACFMNASCEIKFFLQFC